MKPRLFIGSSSERLLYTYVLQDRLKSNADVTLLNQGFFEMDMSNLDSLIFGLNDQNFWAFIFVPDDILKIRDDFLSSI